MNTEFPIGIVADTERRVRQLQQSFVDATVTEYVEIGGLGYSCTPPQKMLALPNRAAKEIDQLLEDVLAMGKWIREQHGR